MSKIKEGDVVYLKTTGERVFVHQLQTIPVEIQDRRGFSNQIAKVRCSDYLFHEFLLEELETTSEREERIRKLYQPVIDALGKNAKTEFQILEEMQGEDDPDDPTKIN